MCLQCHQNPRLAIATDMTIVLKVIVFVVVFSELTNVAVIEAMLQMSQSRNPRLRNLATIFVAVNMHAVIISCSRVDF
jgi:hypothetical protein